MFVNSIDEKPIFKRPDGIEVKDLTSSMFDLRTNNYVNYTAYKVPKEFEMRPDLIAGAAYNNTLYAEFILKYNGISNPFTIMEGDIILIPDLNSMQGITSKSKGAKADNAKAIRNAYKYIDPLKVPKSDTNSYQNKSLVGGAKEGALPPNIAQEGEKQITYRNGRVFFGGSADTCLQNGMTSSEFLTTAIKSKRS
jgi:hypothetical protein